MKHRLREAIEFPANPFVALADFVIVLVFILMLALVRQSVMSGHLIERMAVDEMQHRLTAMAGGSGLAKQQFPLQRDPVLQKAYNQGLLRETYVDGDLQRFRLSEALLAPPERVRFTPRGEQILRAFGRMLASQQGSLRDPGSGLFKRATVEGHSARSEGSDDRSWDVSIERARAAMRLLQDHTGLAPDLVELSGHGRWGDAVTEHNARVDIVIVYAGARASRYLNDHPLAQPAKGVRAN